MAVLTYKLKKLNSSLAFVRAVVNVTADAAIDTDAVRTLRVAVDGSGNAKILAYGKFTNTTYSLAFQGVVIYSVAAAATDFTYQGAAADTLEGSQPFYNSTNGRYYVTWIQPALKGGTSLGGVAASVVVADISSSVSADLINSSPSRYRAAAVVGDYTADCTSTTVSLNTGVYGAMVSGLSTVVQKYPPPLVHQATSGEILVPVGLIGENDSRVYEINVLTHKNPKALSFDGSVYSGGAVGKYDGYQPSELGFYNKPIIRLGSETAGADLASGTYSYVAVFGYMDADGEIHYSRVSNPASFTSDGSHHPVVYVDVPSMSTFPNDSFVIIARTIASGTQYFTLAVRPVSCVTGSVTTDIWKKLAVSYEDRRSDASISSEALLFRQPGTSGTPLDRCNPLSGNHIVRHKDRVFYCHRNMVFYSSFAVDGEAPWFSPAFSFRVGGEEPITGLASMDGTLVVFKENSIYLVDGDGPPENGGTGAEFSPPRQIQARHGCNDPRTIVSTPKGIMYRSNHGIELLERGFQVSWIGARIGRTTDTYPYSGGATFDSGRNIAFFPMAKTLDGTRPTLLNTGVESNPGLVAAYNFDDDAWTVSTYRLRTGGAPIARNTQDVCYCHGTDLAGNQGGFVYSACDDKVFIEEPGNYLDETSFGDIGNSLALIVPWNLTTGWIKGPSITDRIRISDAWLLGWRTTNHDINMSYLADYVRTTTTSIKTFDSLATTLEPEILQFQPAKESVKAMQLVITTDTPTGSGATALSTGSQLELHGITVRLGLKTGGAMLPVTQKG